MATKQLASRSRIDRNKWLPFGAGPTGAWTRAASSGALSAIGICLVRLLKGNNLRVVVVVCVSCESETYHFAFHLSIVLLAVWSYERKQKFITFHRIDFNLTDCGHWGYWGNNLT